MKPRDHQLFQKYPLNGPATISIGEVPTPYQIYDGYGLFIGGTCAMQAVKHLLKDEMVTPIQTWNGKVVAGIWICNFNEASLGPHHELQFSFFVSEWDAGPIAFHPLNTLVLMLARPDVRMLCYGLWNNTPTVLAYNRELLSLNACLSDSRIEREAGKVSFYFNDIKTKKRILSGVITNLQRASIGTTLSLMSRKGFRTTLALSQQPWISMKILNPLGVVLDRHATAEAFTKTNINVVRYFDRRSDILEFGDSAYDSLGFIPSCIQYMDGFKFVYLAPK